MKRITFFICFFLIVNSFMHSDDLSIHLEGWRTSVRYGNTKVAQFRIRNKSEHEIVVTDIRIRNRENLEIDTPNELVSILPGHSVLMDLNLSLSNRLIFVESYRPVLELTERNGRVYTYSFRVKGRPARLFWLIIASVFSLIIFICFFAVHRKLNKEEEK